MNNPRSYPSTHPHGTMTSTARAHTEPASNGFLRSVMRQSRDIGDIGASVRRMYFPEKRLTQEEQDAEDERARKRAMKNLINSWQERLQLISVITTFFATTEASILVNTKPADSDVGSHAMQASNACLLGSLILHVYASVLSFLGAFILITYKLREATRQEMIAEGMELANSPTTPMVIKDLERDAAIVQQFETPANDGIARQNTTASTPENDLRLLETPIFSSDPHIEQVGLFMSNISSHLMSRTHGLCVFLTAVGFILAIVGIMCYAWALESLAVNIFASACLGFALLGIVVLWF